MTQIVTFEQILHYLQQNPVWVSAFASGEGSFTASVMIDQRAMWCMWPQCEFNVTQLMRDEVLLKAINAFFHNTGGVYTRDLGVGAVQFRNMETLMTVIIPFFENYPLLGAKGLEFERWTEMVQLVHSKAHVGNTLASRDALIKFLLAARVLNSRDTRIMKRKVARNELLVNWLTSLDAVPTPAQKAELVARVKALKLD